jgi:hypothetical protein
MSMFRKPETTPSDSRAEASGRDIQNIGWSCLRESVSSAASGPPYRASQGELRMEGQVKPIHLIWGKSLMKKVILTVAAVLTLAGVASACAPLLDQIVTNTGKTCVYANGNIARVCTFCNCPLCGPTN